MAAAELGVPADRARLAFPGGAVAMIDAWFDAIDRAMLAAFPPERIAAMKIRERIRDLVLFRLEAAAPHREALRRALAILAMPQNALAGRAARLAQRRPDVAARRRHRDRLQPLYQARRSWSASMARPCSSSSTTRARAWPRPAPSSTGGSRTSCASRKPRRAGRGSRHALLAQPLPRPAPLSGRLAPAIDNHSQRGH